MKFEIYLEAIKKDIVNYTSFINSNNKKIEKQEEMFLRQGSIKEIQLSPNITLKEFDKLIEDLNKKMKEKNINSLDEVLPEFSDNETLNKFKKNNYVKDQKESNIHNFYFLINNTFYSSSIKKLNYNNNKVNAISFTVMSNIEELRKKEGSFGNKSTPDSSGIFNVIFSIIKKETRLFNSQNDIFSYSTIPSMKEAMQGKKVYETMRSRLYVLAIKKFFGDDVNFKYSGDNVFFSKKDIPFGSPIKQKISTSGKK